MAALSNYSLFSAFVLSIIYAGSIPNYLCVSLALLGLSLGGVLSARENSPPCCKCVTGLLFGIPIAYSALDVISLGRWFPDGIFHMHLAVAIAIASTGLALAFNNARSYLRAPISFFLLIPVLLILFLSFLCGIYGVDVTSRLGHHVEISWVQGGILGLLSVHILLRQPLRWPVSAMFSDYPQIKLLRYMLGVFTVLPVLIGALGLVSEQLGFVDLKLAAVFFVFAIVTLFWAAVIKGSGWAFRVSQMRDMAVRRLEESWRSREAYFRSLVDDSPVILYMTNEAGGCTFISQKWEEYTGVNVIKDLGFGWLERVHPEDRDRIKAFANSVPAARHEPFSLEYRLLRHDNNYRWVISTGIPRFDDKHQFIGYMGCVNDVHDRKVQEATLIRDKKTAEQSNRTKSQFLANMSHEIRTPLNAILGFADLCGDNGCDNSDRVEYLKRIRWNGDHLLRLIDDILDLAKMESGSPLVQKSQFSIERTISEIIESLKALASQKGLKLEFSTSGDLPPVVHSDPHRIKQVVTNLVGNAIKFTNSGRVLVNLSAGPEKIEVEISDTGIGLEEYAKENLFKPFSQGDSSVTRRFGGTGLGLHLSRKLAQSIDGDVQLKYSEPGHGSVFVFTFAIGADDLVNRRRIAHTVSPSRMEPAQQVLQRRFYGRKILVAEDSVDSRELLQIYFRPTGAQIMFAENGLEAVNMARETKPDLILMDVQMPVLDGLEATRRLRSTGFSKPIVALTAHALQDEVDRSFEAGCNYHLTKPIMKDVLITLVGDLLHHPPQSRRLHH